MKRAIMFAKQESLNFLQIRNNVIRIPEVYSKAKEAQSISDELGTNSYFQGVDFSLVFLQDDYSFKSNLKLQNVLQIIVQLGLYERYTKKFGAPQYIVGDVGGDSTANIVAAQSTFRSLFMINENPGELRVVSDEPILSGATMGLNQIYDLQADGEPAIYETKQDVELLLQYLVEEKNVKKIVNIGPGLTNSPVGTANLSSYDIQMCESIDVDPMLNWFWPIIRQAV